MFNLVYKATRAILAKISQPVKTQAHIKRLFTIVFIACFLKLS